MQGGLSRKAASLHPIDGSGILVHPGVTCRQQPVRLFCQQLGQLKMRVILIDEQAGIDGVLAGQNSIEAGLVDIGYLPVAIYRK